MQLKILLALFIVSLFLQLPDSCHAIGNESSSAAKIVSLAEDEKPSDLQDNVDILTCFLRYKACMQNGMDPFCPVECALRFTNDPAGERACRIACQRNSSGCLGEYYQCLENVVLY